jgi:hypothetical protein
LLFFSSNPVAATDDGTTDAGGFDAGNYMEIDTDE